MIRYLLTLIIGSTFYFSASAQTFNTVTQAFFTGVGYSNASWGDYDSDGDPDILICGQDQFGTKYAKLYRNNLDSTFTDMLISFIPVHYGSSAWGDYDRDGDLDVIITGADNAGTKTANLYTNNAGNFTNANAGLQGVLYGSSDWGDYDNDGDLDLIVTGMNAASSPSTAIYKNTNGLFSSITHSITPVTGGTALWGDYNNDNYLDVLINGTDASNSKVCKIYKNNKKGAFVDQLVVGLSGVSFGATAWADFDNDGDLDIAVAGTDAFSVRVCNVYRNLGNNAFTNLFAVTTGVAAASMAWGDFENDGDLDLMVTGNTSLGQLAKLYTNTGTTFTDSGLSFTGLFSGSVSWADFDKDNDLDVLVSGFSSGGNIVTLYRNKATTANTLPSVPTNTAESISEDTARLSWSSSTDAQTSTAGLTYNLFISTSKAAVNTLSPAANTSTGYRKISTIGNAGLTSTYEIKGLDQGKYYWSVQAIDNAYAGSPFALLDSFVVCRKFSLGNDTTICFKDSISLKAGVVGDVVNWFSFLNPVLATNQLSIKPEITANDTIWAQRNNAVSGCLTYDTIIVNVNPVSIINQGADTTICDKSTIQLGGIPTATGSILPYTYQWTPGLLVNDSTIANPIAITAKDTTFRLIVKAGSCKPDTAFVLISLRALPQLIASRDTSIGAGESTPLQASGALTYSWSPTAALSNHLIANPTASPIETTTYLVTGTDVNGCKGTDSVNVFVKNDLFIPDLFSPDGNGTNEAFKIFGAGIKEIEFKVYNRYGEVLYESSDADELLRKGWDGTYKGTPQTTGTYLWTMEGKTFDGTELKYKGKKSGMVVLKR